LSFKNKKSILVKYKFLEFEMEDARYAKSLFSANPILWARIETPPAWSATDSSLAYLSIEFMTLYGDYLLGDDKRKYKSFIRDFPSIPRNLSDTDGGVLTFGSMWRMLSRELPKICRASPSSMGKLNVILPRNSFGKIAEKAIVITFSETATAPSMWCLYLSSTSQVFEQVSSDNPARVFVLEV
jgi:hypothetical protein